MLWIRGLQIPWFDRSNLFLRRIANPSGRLAGCGTPGGVWDAWRGVERLAGYGTAGEVWGTAGEGDFRAQKKVVES